MINVFKKKRKTEDSKPLEIIYEKSSGIPFKWEYEIENTNICKFERSYSIGEKTKEPICGGSVETHYLFKGLQKGKTKIIFKCINFADHYISEINEYKVEVDQDKNITLLEKKIKK